MQKMDPTTAPVPTLRIEPVAERHFAGLHLALDTVARERRYLTFTQAPPFAQATAFYRDIVDHGLCQVVALLDQTVVGWCDVLPGRGQARSHVGTLGIGVVPAARHRGIGPQLLRHAIDGAWARGMCRIELSVRADNPRAQALYQRFGFTLECRQRHAYCIDGTYCDGLLMALLRPGLA